jgi:hypothetical protein
LVWGFILGSLWGCYVNKDDFLSHFLDKNEYPVWLPEQALDVLHKYLDIYFMSFGSRELEIPETEYEWEDFERKIDHLKPYIRCLKDKKMEYCWNKINEMEFISDYSKSEWLAHALWESLPHKCNNPSTKTQTEAWKRKTVNALKTAKELSQQTPMEMGHWLTKFNRPYKHFQSAIYDTPEIQRAFDMFGGYFYPWHIIEIMMQCLENTDHNSLFYGGNISGENGRKIYFINSLTCALLQKTGKPCRKIVAISTSVAFNFKISNFENYYRMIRRTTKDIDPNEHLNVVDDMEQEPFVLTGDKGHYFLKL